MQNSKTCTFILQGSLCAEEAEYKSFHFDTLFGLFFSNFYDSRVISTYANQSHPPKVDDLIFTAMSMCPK